MILSFQNEIATTDKNKFDEIKNASKNVKQNLVFLQPYFLVSLILELCLAGVHIGIGKGFFIGIDGKLNIR